MTTPSIGSGDSEGAFFRERLTVPWWTWLAALFWAATLGVAYGHSLGVAVGTMVGALSLALAAAGLVQVSTVIVVDRGGLSVGSAHLPLAAMGQVAVLDAEAARRRRGPEADPRAYTALRGWVPFAVTIDVDDVRDPTPFWYVSTRRPEVLAEALEQARAAAEHDRISPSARIGHEQHEEGS